MVFSNEFFVGAGVFCCYGLECVLYLITLGLFEFARYSGYCVPEIGHLGMVRGALGLPDGVLQLASKIYKPLIACGFPDRVLQLVS